LKKNLFRLLVESGVREDDSHSMKRGTVFSNYIALFLCAAAVVLFLIIPQNHNLGGLTDALVAFVIFGFPIFLNRWSLITLNRLYLCFTPPVVITVLMIMSMMERSVVPTSAYDGIRIYLLATSCIPYLLLDRSNVVLFISGILPTLLLLLFCDQLLTYLGVGHEIKGSPDEGYATFTQARSVIAYFLIGGCCFSLRYIVDRTDSLNSRLIAELKQKNEIIQRQAEGELSLLNQQLRENLNKLTEHELILKRSQEIAKVGSWELSVKDGAVYWSDQMYEIFGVDKNLDLRNGKLNSALFNESAPLIEKAQREAVQQKKSYDFTIQARMPVGYVKWVRVVGFPIMVNNEVTAVGGIVHDVTLFKESEERVKANEKNYRALFEQATDAITINDLHGNFVDVNTGMCKLLGYSREEFLMKKLTDILDPEHVKDHPLKYDKLVIGEHIFSERWMRRKDGKLVIVEANIRMLSEGKFMAIGRDITNRKVEEQEKERVRYTLNERVKELTTLYKTSQILQAEEKPVHEVLQDLVSILPAGWQYPPITAARISLAGMEFVTPNYDTTYKARQLAEFTARNGLQGTIEVVYLESRPEDAEGPFLIEERDLINMIADMVRLYLSRRYEAEALRQIEANQSATINNTNFLIWSVNQDYEVISFNKPFAAFMRSLIGVEVQLGKTIAGGKSEMNELIGRWTARYSRALTGETFKVGSEIGDRTYEYSLNPIVEEGRIIGVSIFGEDISERLKLEKEMLAVNKQMGEFRLMALRSVMNPHFIFNCLNSIQYYIMESDQVNAVKYLSTFSKLIRSILNHSVKSRVRLAEELEMLKHYIQLEALRFEDKFDFVIDLDPTIDVESVEIPSMLIQPYVENAILHGLYNKKGKGLLKISIRAHDRSVLVEIEDNGVGRKAASAMKPLNLQQHKSMGTALTEERLKLINAGDAASVEITDLESEYTPAGTRVSVRIKE
jgi:PAS domain S-box-containing protein